MKKANDTLAEELAQATGSVLRLRGELGLREAQRWTPSEVSLCSRRGRGPRLVGGSRGGPGGVSGLGLGPGFLQHHDPTWLGLRGLRSGGRQGAGTP